MDNVVNFPGTQKIRIVLPSDLLEEVRRKVLAAAGEYLKLTSPQLYKEEGMNTGAIEALLAAGMLNMCATRILDDAREEVGSEKEFDRLQDFLKEELDNL